MDNENGSGPRICILRQDFFPENIHVRRDTRALLEAGYKVDVIAMRAKGETRSEMIDGVQIYRLPLRHRRGGIFRYLWEYTAFFLMAFIVLNYLSIKRRYRVVEVDSMPDFLVFAAIIPKILGVKVVLYLFECMPELFEHGYNLSSNHPVIRMLRFIEGQASRFAHHVIYCGPGYQEIQKKRTSGPVQSTVILNVPAESIFSPQKATPPRAEIDGRPFRLITHGSILKRYGLETLIHAVPLLLEKIPDLEVLIVGDGEYRPELENIARELGVENRVMFTGRVSQEDIPDMITGSDVGIVAFTHDCALAWKLFEYMAMQRPTVHSSVKFTVDFCCNEEVLFFAPGDEQELAERVLWLYSHPGERLAMVDRANRLYEKNNWSISRERYLDVYGSLISGSHFEKNTTSHHREKDYFESKRAMARTSSTNDRGNGLS